MTKNIKTTEKSWHLNPRPLHSNLPVTFTAAVGLLSWGLQFSTLWLRDHLTGKIQLCQKLLDCLILCSRLVFKWQREENDTIQMNTSIDHGGQHPLRACTVTFMPVSREQSDLAKDQNLIKILIRWLEYCLSLELPRASHKTKKKT
jgi:hypothetical protein